MNESIANMKGWMGGRSELPPQTMYGLSVRIIRDESAQRYDEKYQALCEAMACIAQAIPQAFDNMPTLVVYMGAGLGGAEAIVPERQEDEMGMRLGDRIFQTNPACPVAGFPPEVWKGIRGGRGVADHQYDAQRLSRWAPRRWLYEFNGSYAARKARAKAVATIVHEFGHLLHAHRERGLYDENRRIDAPLVPPALIEKVSSYIDGQNNFDEFVAEVFTGILHGKRYPADVMAAYDKYGGPAVPGI